MNIVKPSYEILGIFPDEEDCLKWLERIGRTCYKSEDKITAGSAPKFVRNILKLGRRDRLYKELRPLLEEAEDIPEMKQALLRNILEAVGKVDDDPPHESVIEHSLMTVRFVCDRGVSHEMVRHRLCAFSQESTRYCSYSSGRFGSEITVIEPPFWKQGEDAEITWVAAMSNSQSSYMELMEDGAKPQEARSVLPNSLKTEIVVSANFREWRHIFRLRTSKKAHPQMRELMVPLLRELKAKRNLGLLFEDIPDPEDV